MSGLTVTLLGKFAIKRNEQGLGDIHARKVQELFCYLALFNQQPHPRESLSELIWHDQPSTSSRKYLRQTLWKLQTALSQGEKSDVPDLLVETDWIQFNPAACHKVDVVDFERAARYFHEKRIPDLTVEDYSAAQKAAALYTGDLLEGWYQEWCIFERERYQIMYLTLLDKMTQYCLQHRDFEAGLAYCAEILRYDRANERAHRQMMRLYFLSGDRTRALRQYERCLSALQEELNVLPSEKTLHLHEQIRQDVLPSKPVRKEMEPDTREPLESASPALEILSKLEQFSETLGHIQHQIQKEISDIEKSMAVGK